MPISRQVTQSHAKPTDIQEHFIGHGTVLQKVKIQPHSPERRQKLPNRKPSQGTVPNPPEWGQTWQLKATKTFYTISVLYWAHLCMKCSLGMSDFLEEISSLSHSVVFLYFFALIAEEGFLISPCYSLELCIQMGISFLFSFAFCFSSFQLFVRPPQTAILLFAFVLLKFRNII